MPQSNPDKDVTVLLRDWLQSGDPDATALVLVELGPRIRSLLIRKYEGTLHADEIEDVLMIAIESLWFARAEFDASKGSVLNWYRQIALNAAADIARTGWCRERQQEQGTDPSRLDIMTDARRRGPHSAPQTSDEPGRLDKLRKVREALARLPLLYRQILLADASSASGKAASQELAKDFDIAPSTIRGYRSRARARLRQEIERTGLHLPASPEGQGSVE